jgi:hypothetical protein
MFYLSWRLSFALKGAYQVRFRYGSRVLLLELCELDRYFRPLVGYLLNEQLQGTLLFS